MALELQVVRTPQRAQLLPGKPVAPSGPSCELTPCRKAPKPAGWAAAAPPSLRGRGSPARRASPEGAGRAAGPRQARHAGPPGPGTPGSLRREEGDAGSVYGAPAAGVARGSIAAAKGSPPVTSRLRSSWFRLSAAGAHGAAAAAAAAAVLSFLFQFSEGASGDGEDPGKRRPSSESGESPQFRGAASPAALSASAWQLLRPVPLRQPLAFPRPAPLACAAD